MNKAFKIIGIATRTTNKNNRSATDLQKLWERFYSEDIIHKIPNKVSDDIYSIYTDYAADYQSDYTSIIGMPVSTLDEIPDGLIGHEFPQEKFQKFTAKGNIPESVLNTWKIIWEKDKELNRKYSFDVEVYGEESHKEENSVVEIYVSVKLLL